MIAAIFKLVGLGGVPQWLAEAVVILVVLGSAIAYLEHRGAVHELASLQKSSAKLTAQAKAEITKLNTEHAAQVAANQEKTNAAVAASNALSAALDGSVRDFDAYRRAHPSVARPDSGPAATSGGECGTQSCADIIVRLGERGDELARSNGELAAVLQGCQRERDLLTGLPK